MNRKVFLGTLLVAGVATVQLRSQDAPPKQRAKHVFIVSFDGGKPSVMQASKMPVTMAMVAEGASTWQAQTIFPSITLPSHVSMLTGVGPDKHKMLWNDYRPESGPVKVATSFQIAKAKGFKTAVFAGKEKFKHLDIPGSLDKIAIPASEAKVVAAAAGKYIESDKPNLCFIHFADSDVVGHKFGWGSPEQVKSFGDEDIALKILRDATDKAGITADSVFILSADHGGHDKTHGSNSPDDMTIPWLVWGKTVKPNFKITSPVTTYDSAATALWLLGIAVPADWDGKPVKSAFVE